MGVRAILSNHIPACRSEFYLQDETEIATETSLVFIKDIFFPFKTSIYKYYSEID